MAGFVLERSYSTQRSCKILAVTWQDLARFVIEISWKDLFKILQRSWQDLVRFVPEISWKDLDKILVRS